MATTIEKHIARLQAQYLEKIGWLRSVTNARAMDAAGGPLPWITYPAIAFLAARLKPTFKVFEYGSGASTLWFASRVDSIVSVEHDESWHAKMTPEMPPNVDYRHRPFDGTSYPTEILNHPGHFNLVMVDGRKRVRSGIAAVERLSPDGVIVWDNSEREYYQPGFDLLTGRGFRRIDFDGLGPARHRSWRTTVFYRRDNCLDI